ncbi:non-ribosomal peptide synthetase [Streptomyces sp. NPDC051000]|uniref:non-ribosomal peptide synthetase n=1 Tax=Streptomyces sp. NPDC051000 TaxID=3155520 RepID=UPI0033E39C34
MSHTKILDRWAGQVEDDGRAPAVTTPDRVWSRRELADFATGLRAALADGDEPARRGPVLVACADPVAVMATILACAAAGRAFAPVDVRQPAARWTAILEDLDPDHVVCDAAGRAALEGCGTGDAVRIDAEEVRVGARSAAAWRAEDWRALDVPDGGYVYFTSGTTGRPKGIRGSLAAVAHFLDWEAEELRIGPGTRISLLTSPGFDAFLRDALLPLCAGGTVEVAGSGGVPVGSALATWLEERGVEVLHCVPTVFRTLRSAELTAGSLPGLRAVLLAGEPVRAADVAWWRGLFGDAKELVNLYGPSETTMTKVFHRLTAEDAVAETVPVGRPMPGVEVRVLLGGKPVTGAIGEVELRTPFPLGGYLDGSAGGFREGDRFRTGDLGRLREDGVLEVLGRRDQQVKVNGVRIELGEIEDVLRRHPGVRDACAAAVEEPGAEAVLCAYVVADGVTDEELRAHTAAGLAPGSRPSVYVRLTSVPRTLNGKTDRRALPLPSAAYAADAGQAPLDGLESEIAAVWSELLHLPGIGRHDDFTLLGGDSLAIARLLDRLRSRFAVDVPVGAFVKRPTVAGLAAVITATRDGHPDPARSTR